jgi:hypothetical protein
MILSLLYDLLSAHRDRICHFVPFEDRVSVVHDATRLPEFATIRAEWERKEIELDQFLDDLSNLCKQVWVSKQSRLVS